MQVRRYTFKYDNKGNKTEEIEYNPDGSIDWKHTFKYDAQWNKTEIIGYNSDGSINYQYTYQYEYDNNGNWIKQIKFKNDIPEYIVEREIEYY